MTYIETERIRQDGYWDIQCAECNKWFEAQRDTATFCGPTCRSRWHRSGPKRQQRIERALAAIEDLIANLPKRGDSPEFAALHRIATRTKSAMSIVETK